MTDDSGDIAIQLQFDWSAAIELEPKFANQFLIQVGNTTSGQPDEIHLIVGHVNPPVIVGDSRDSQLEQLARYQGKLPVIVHGRYALTRARLDELLKTLNEVARKYDDLAGGDAE